MMKYLMYLYIALILITLSGCSVSLRPEASEPSDLEDGYYYGDSAYRYYYGLPAPSVYDYYEYSSNYNPWTMGTYYENYSPPKRNNTSSDTSNDRVTTTTEDKHPSIRSTDQATSNQPKAPVNESSSIRRERNVERERSQIEATTSSSTSSNQKTRRETIRNQESQTPRENHNIQNNTQNTQTEIKKDENTNNTDEEEKEKQKRRRRSVN